MFQMSLEVPPGMPIFKELTWINSRVWSTIPGSSFMAWIVVVVASSCFMVLLTSWSTLRVWISEKVRFSSAQMKDEMGRVNRIVKKVISGVVQQLISLQHVGEVAMKHHGGASCLFWGVAASSTLILGSSMFRTQAMVVQSFRTVVLASGLYPASCQDQAQEEDR